VTLTLSLVVLTGAKRKVIQTLLLPVRLPIVCQGEPFQYWRLRAVMP
jgi:hypothetical protein